MTDDRTAGLASVLKALHHDTQAAPSETKYPFGSSGASAYTDGFKAALKKVAFAYDIDLTDDEIADQVSKNELRQQLLQAADDSGALRGYDGDNLFGYEWGVEETVDVIATHFGIEIS